MPTNMKILEQAVPSTTGNVPRRKEALLISRRLFLVLTGTAAITPRAFSAASEFPPMLDHIILSCSSLDSGIAFVEEHTGVLAVPGGVHPNRGTANALLSLGKGHYLEIMGPDPRAKALEPTAIQQLNILKELTTPRLTHWAINSSNVEALAKKLHESGIATLALQPGSRKRPDGGVVRWKRLILADDHDGLLPFFIEWSADSVHPSSNAPPGCRIERFAAADKNPGELSKRFQRMGVDMLVERSETPQLRAKIAGPKGALEVRS